ncbi:DUF6843 domain-containing protein [Paenibacillus sp. FJAT-27812]|uniref:DUF6843 domain-containing protein n=1 Tax=Paenibacillus sp. FJAT-27812 TaxID=1684143 RepID=UPI0006A797A8|nr:hypothetical protein [Paenibacillus sp. FJAT-27812]
MIKHRKYGAVDLFVGLIGVLALIAVIAGFWLTRTSSTDDIYLIPEGFEGNIQVNYNVKGAPMLVKEGKFDVIPINADGTFDTSKPDMEYGLVTDQYYYVSQDGRRTPIDTLCVYGKGNGSSEIGSIITRHTYLQITKTKCSEEFSVWGR